MPRKRTRSPSRARPFLRALVASAVSSFVVASCALNTPLREQLPIEPLLALVDIEDRVTPAVAPPVGGYVHTRYADCPQFFPDGKAPVVPAWPGLRELCYDAFAILHSGSTKTPVFVAQRLNREILQRAQVVKRKDRFFADARLPRGERAQLDDYRGSGYSRGHMAPAADMHTVEAMAQSFSLANMVPQDQRHNGGPWAKVEEDTRRYVMRARGDVYVFTGPVYQGLSARIGDGAVAVPTHLFKLVYDVTSGRSWVHWQANSPDASVASPISYEEFVRRTDLRLLPAG